MTTKLKEHIRLWKDKRNNTVKTFFLKHQTLSTIIAFIFIICNIYGNYIALSQSMQNMGNLEKKTGTIRGWYRTHGSYNTAYLTIKGDTTIYIKDRVGGWFNNLQHSGKQGEKVVFYTIKKETLHTFASEEPHYFGLSKETNPRSAFWIFFDLLFYNLGKVFIFWFTSYILSFLWSAAYVKNRFVLFVSGSLFAITTVLFLLACFS